MMIRALLARENAKRDQEPRDETYDEVYIDIVEDGEKKIVKVDKVFMDLTDKQNRDFRYVL